MAIENNALPIAPAPAGLLESNLPDKTTLPGVQPGKKITVDGVTYERIPIKVPRLIEFGENLETLLAEYVKPHFQSGDWVALSEKLVSISQNRVRHISTVRVTWLARLVQKGVMKHKNMTAWDNPPKIQVAIEEAGWWRIIPAMAIGAFGKLIGKRGWFWIVAGNRVSEIDGFIPEDMYPYTEWAVLPAANPQATCSRIESDLGMPCMTGDMNFIDVKILGASRGIGLDFATIRRIMLDNPLGQGNKMTPFCLVRKVIVPGGEN
jgi:hypothetical protein